MRESKEGRATVTEVPARPEDQQPIINFAGEKVALGPVRRDLVPLYLKWINDFEVTRFIGHIGPTAREAKEVWYGRVSKAENQARFTIYEKARMRPIGYTDLCGIDHANRTAEFEIMIGEKECWGKGYGTEVTRLMLEYGFTCLGLYNISLWVNAANERGIKAYRRAGFMMAGRLRQCDPLGGRAYDAILMDCLATEFQGGALKHLLPDSQEATE